MSLARFACLACAVAALVALHPAASLPQSPASRPAEDVERDQFSKPLEVFDFFGIEPAMTVMDFSPGTGYNTALLSALVGADGEVLAGPDRGEVLAARLAESPLSNVRIVENVSSLEDGSVDAIVTVRNLHDVELYLDAPATYADWFRVLRPGGILGVVDARAAGPGVDEDTHRIHEDTAVEQLTAAGFVLDGRSDLLANPDDDFTKYEGTGDRLTVDRFVLRFRKPGSAEPGDSADSDPARYQMGRMMGRWETDNHRWSEGSGLPRAYRMAFDWGSPERRHALGTLSAVMADGTEEVRWHLFMFWHPHQKRILVYQVHVDGTLVHGSEVISDGDRKIAETWLVQPDGTMTFSRHRVRFIDEDTHTTGTLVLGESGDWRALGDFTWRRREQP